MILSLDYNIFSKYAPTNQSHMDCVLNYLLENFLSSNKLTLKVYHYCFP